MGKKIGLLKDVTKAFGVGAVTYFIPLAVAGTVGRAVGNGAIRGEIDLEDSIKYGVKSGAVAATIFGLVNVALEVETIKYNYNARKHIEEVKHNNEMFQEVGE